MDRRERERETEGGSKDGREVRGRGGGGAMRDDGAECCLSHNH